MTNTAPLRPTLEGVIADMGIDRTFDLYPCPGCGKLLPPFALVVDVDGHPEDALCVDCVIDRARPPSDFEMSWADVRHLRSVELARTDWTQAGDLPADLRDCWRDYRQQLRDITDQGGRPCDAVFPISPEGV
jgi:hypothetical protein